MAGGVAVYAAPGSPSNKMIGVGFDGVPEAAHLDAVEGAFAERNAPLQAEISTIADPALHGCLARRGYTPSGFENVLGHPLTDLEPVASKEVVIERAVPADFAEWVSVMISAFATPDEGGVGGEAAPPGDALRRFIELMLHAPDYHPFVARIEGRVVGSAMLRLDAGIAQFCGAGTLPAFRRRGVQTAPLRTRLLHARDAGCDVAVIVTQPASKSQQNTQREGFSLLYARQLLVKSPVGTA
jgi:GNAT superfamily N-acetyltransferase